MARRGSIRLTWSGTANYLVDAADHETLDLMASAFSDDPRPPTTSCTASPPPVARRHRHRRLLTYRPTQPMSPPRRRGRTLAGSVSADARNLPGSDPGGPLETEGLVGPGGLASAAIDGSHLCAQTSSGGCRAHCYADSSTVPPSARAQSGGRNRPAKSFVSLPGLAQILWRPSCQVGQISIYA